MPPRPIGAPSRAAQSGHAIRVGSMAPARAHHRQYKVCSLDRDLQALCEQGNLQGALDVLSCMGTTIPSHKSYLSLLKACNRLKNPSHACQVHAHLALHRLDLTSILGDSLVVTLAKCGAIEEAHYLLHSLPHRTVFSWTAIISAYTNCGRAPEALQTHAHMLQDCIEPDLYTFVSLFKACGSIPNLEEGRRLHAEAQRKGFTSNAFVGSSLVSMYGKCASIMEAEKVFVEMSQHDVVSWTAMISAYVDGGLGERALQLYRQMQEEDPSPYKILLVMALQACGCLVEEDDAIFLQGQPTKVVCLDIGQALHAEARMKGSVSDVFVGSALVSMYGRCGTIVHAENVFLGLCQHDVASWNSMLSAYVEQGQAVKALWLYKQMQEEGAIVNKLTLVIALQACGIFAEKEEAIIEGQPIKVISLHLTQAFHDDAARKELISDVFVGSTLASLYGKCGSIVEAGNVFSGLSQHNVVSWTAMVSAYVEQGQGNKALQLYRQMQKNGVSPDQHAFVIAIQACSILVEKQEATLMVGRLSKTMAFEIGQALHAEARMRGFVSNIFVGSTLVSMYGKCGSIVEAENIFNGLSTPRNIVSWTAMLSTYAEQGQEYKALQLYHQMQKEGTSPDQHVFMIVLQACGTLGENEVATLLEGQPTKLVFLEIGKALHVDVKRRGFTSDVFVGSTLVSMYGKCGTIADAENVFKVLSQHNVMSWTAMLSAYVEQSQGDKALELYKHMQKDGVTLDDVILVCILKACSSTGSLEVCRQLHFSIVSTWFDSSLTLTNTLINAYGSCASMVDAQVVADGLAQPDVVSWNACIAGYAQDGNSVGSLQMFESMQLAGNEPDGITFLSLLSSCSHMGLIDKGFEYFESMSRDYCINPDSKHYVVMIDLLGRAGDLEMLKDIMWRSPMQSNASIWLCFLGACCKHSNVDLGEHAFNHIVALQPMEATAYVLMSNMYADIGLQE